MTKNITFEFDTLSMDGIAKEIEERSIDAIIDDSMLWDTDSGVISKTFDDILYHDAGTLVTDKDDSTVNEEEIIKNLDNFHTDLDKDGEDLDHIIINVDKSSLTLITPVAVQSKFEKPAHHNLPIGSVLNKIYPRRVSQSSDVPSSISLHHTNSSIPAHFMDVLQQRWPFNGNASANMISLPAAKTENTRSLSEYMDMSTLTDEEAAKRCDYSNMRGRTQEPFPVKLHSIIERSEEDQYSSIISWAPHGRAFKIHNEVLFVGAVLPVYFFQSKMSSFTRQLRMYGFHKIRSKLNVDKGSYYNELFLRGRPGLACGIVRLNTPCAASRKNEPNLYDIFPMPYIKPCGQKESSPSKEEVKEKDAINLRTIRYASSS